MDIVLKVEETPVRYVVDVAGIAVAITHTHLTQTPIRHPIHREVVQVAEVVAPEELQSHAGLEQVRLVGVAAGEAADCHQFLTERLGAPLP